VESGVARHEVIYHYYRILFFSFLLLLRCK
jgi:hypothetical protein